MKYLHELNLEELMDYRSQCPKPGKGHSRRNINRRQQLEIVDSYIKEAKKNLK